MTKKVIFSDAQFELNYDDGLPDQAANKGFWLREKTLEDNAGFANKEYKQITAPFSIKIGANEVSIVKANEQDVLFWRTKNQQTWDYRSYEPN